MCRGQPDPQTPQAHGGKGLAGGCFRGRSSLGPGAGQAGGTAPGSAWTLWPRAQTSWSSPGCEVVLGRGETPSEAQLWVALLPDSPACGQLCAPCRLSPWPGSPIICHPEAVIPSPATRPSSQNDSHAAASRLVRKAPTIFNSNVTGVAASTSAASTAYEPVRGWPTLGGGGRHGGEGKLQGPLESVPTSDTKPAVI